MERDSPNLDFLRSIAVLLVFVNHFLDFSGGDGTRGSLLWHVGQLGVLIFFVHTCLVLMWSLERSAVQGRELIVPFYIRRAMRLYPLSIACVLLAWCFDARWMSPNLWQNLTLTQYVFFHGKPSFPPLLGTLWTLPLEVEMYIALPLLFLFFRSRSFQVLGAVWAIFFAIAFYQARLSEGFLILLFVPCFLGGVVAWRLMRDRDLRRLPSWLWPIAIVAASAFWMLATLRHLPLFTGVFGLSLGLAIPWFREIESQKIRTASKLIARYSYSIYLTHFPIMVYVMTQPLPGHPSFRFLPPMPVIPHYGRPIHALLVVAGTCLASFLLYHGIEDPGIRLGRSFARRFMRPMQPVIPDLTALPQTAEAD